MFRMLLILTFFVGGAAHAQFSYYVHELTWNETDHAFLGLVNPGTETHKVSVTCFGDDGSQVGLFQLDLLPRRHREVSAETLIVDGNTTWARIDSSGQIAGYVRYEGVSGGRMSAVPFSHFTAGETWLPQLSGAASDITSRAVLVNTTGNEGMAYFDPVRIEENGLTKSGEPTMIPNFGAPYQRAELNYGSAFEKTDNLVWDHITGDGNISLSGAWHFTGNDNAAIVLNRTPHRRMIVGPMQPNKDGSWNKLVLVNTYPGKLPVTLTAYYGFYSNTNLPLNGPITIELELDAYEQRTFDIDKPTQLDLPANATWYHIEPHEGGLVGYQLFGSDDGHMLAALEGMGTPTSLNTLPYTPSSADLVTDIAVINPTDRDIPVHILGFNNKGLRQAQVISHRLRPGEKWVASTDDLFGSRAQNVTWIQTMQSQGELFSYSVIRKRDGSAMAALQGMPSYAKDGDLFKGDFDHLNFSSLDVQGWKPVTFNKGGSLNPNEIIVLRTQYGYERNLPGEFFLEHSFDGVDGFFYLGYDPFHSDTISAVGHGELEQVGLVSPWLEIPQFGTWNLSFYLRLFNPEFTTETSQYGIVWQEEGSNQWHWFGLSGWKILYPDLWVGDCWAPIQWRNEIVTVTNWLPFESALPDSVRGKRIRLGYYYAYQPDSADDKAPWLWLDRVRISPKKLDFSLFYDSSGHGTFEYIPEDE